MRLADTLTTLRRQRRDFAVAAGHYKAAYEADSLQLRTTTVAWLTAVAAFDEQSRQAATWKARARRRGLLNWAGAALLAGISYTLLMHP